ncbi:MAG TPA: hypothetical protein VFG19_04100 [Geobacteraceae bacterium]|nr:hypothetical protein [Geobacteraceae bacterium]
MRKELAVVFLLIVNIFLLDAIKSVAAEQVVKLRRSYSEVSNQVFCQSEAACNSSLFEVYTVQETNAMMDDLKAQIDSVAKQAGNVDQKINAAESRMKGQVTRVLDTMPQLLLSDQARDAIRTAVMSVEQEELSQIRRDMQKQIDELKRQIEKLKRTK